MFELRDFLCFTPTKLWLERRGAEPENKDGFAQFKVNAYLELGYLTQRAGGDCYENRSSASSAIHRHVFHGIVVRDIQWMEVVFDFEVGAQPVS
ncbi:hypothetical protein Hypma_016383 [Hypsizygus marmoreus]|uniref:Uncharacterized protein n=1 Tax=Hypsizygus marmoreus TaxID=39966 RepID=A0A369IXR4_HYPMA|nr:hypothetical protein Hypma_016383 [Hypsizygus marmoreus]